MSKPVVGVVYSESGEGSLESRGEGSLESRSLGLFLAAHVAATGYALVYLIGYSNVPKALDPLHRISYIPIGKTAPIEAPGSDIEFCHFESIADCDVLLVAIEPGDTSSFCDKMLEMIPDKKGIVVISLQRGVKGHSNLKSKLSNKKGLIVVEGSVNFAVVPAPKSGALVSTVPQGGFILERLSKDMAKHAEGPVNLLEYTNFPILFQKIITPHTWGTLAFECLYALNVLTGGTLSSTLTDSDWRLIYATMIREACESLFEAARGGAWKPSMESLLSFGATLWFMEMILVLPYPLFSIIASIIRLPRPDLPSPGQVDINSGRKTAAANHLSDLLSSGSRSDEVMPVCTAVLRMIRAAEESKGKSLADRGRSKSELLRMIGKSNTVIEFRYWALRLATLVSVLVLILYFLIHD